MNLFIGQEKRDFETKWALSNFDQVNDKLMTNFMDKLKSTKFPDYSNNTYVNDGFTKALLLSFYLLSILF